MENPNKNLKLKKAQKSEVVGSGGNKIILKKINKFFDYEKMDTTYNKETVMSGNSSE
jgi:hypothetical protein